MEQHEIRTRRKALGLSITQLAEYVGDSQQYISQLENNGLEGKKTGRVASAEKLTTIEQVLIPLEELQRKALEKVPIKKPRAIRTPKADVKE